MDRDVAPLNFSQDSGHDLDPPSLSGAWATQQQHYDQEYPHVDGEEDDLMAYADEMENSGTSGSNFPPPNGMEDDAVPSSTSDFVKKLYRILEDPTFQSILCWGAEGDSFIVKDMTECARTVLPRVFKHSNFASFVRQLNKYDFHKVKRTTSNPYGEHSWTFQHPEFHANRPEALDRVQRKPSGLRRPAPPPRSYSSTSSLDEDQNKHRRQSSFDFREKLKNENMMELRMSSLEENQQRIIEEMINFQQVMARQAGLIQSSIAHSLSLKGEEAMDAALIPSTDATVNTSDPDPSSPSYPEESTRRNRNFDTDAVSDGRSNGNDNGDQSSSSLDNEIESGFEAVVEPTKSNAKDSSSTIWSSSSENAVTPSERQKLGVRRSTFVPGWEVPPHVLLVDDDGICRRLGSKFLEVSGCTIDIAIDGVSAVNKMNLEKYDLVLMDIVMPKLDGVSATNLIRKFDKGTPIISMTGNSAPNQIMSYHLSGMNDILAKPFTQNALLNILEKHLVHLKVAHNITKLPRSIGVPPLSNFNFQHALTASASNLFMQQQQQVGGSLSRALTPSVSSLASSNSISDGLVSAPSPFNPLLLDDEARINPFAGRGISDDHYRMLMQNNANGDGLPGIVQSVANSPSPTWGSDPTAAWSSGLTEKRPLNNSEDDLREEKRSRFEVIE